MGETTTGVRAVLSAPLVYELWSWMVGGEHGRSTLVLEHVRPRTGDRVLDLGCGPGELLPYLGEVDYTGVDISERYIDRARERFDGRAEFRVGDATAIDADLEGFDLVIAFGVLHHIDDAGVRRLFDGAARALKPGGRAVTVDPVFAPGQSRAARAVIARDRGQHVRSPEGYAPLASDAFASVETTVRGDLLRIPYTHCVLECQGGDGGDRRGGARVRARVATGEPPGRKPQPALDRRLLAAVFLLAPIVAVLVQRLPLINQLDYADAWFYSAYAWVPKHHFEIFQLNYFAVRFPAILSIGAFEHLLGAQYGYVALRYLLAIACSASVYIGVRRVASSPVALAAGLLLFVNPFFTRMLLWDYAGFIAVSAGVIGFSLWYWADDRALAWTLIPGAALATAVFANALLATAVFVLLVVEAVAALRLGRAAVLRYVARLGVSAGAAIGVFVLGYLGYLATLGGLSPDDLLEPTISFLSDNSQNSAPYVRPVSEWLFHDPRIWGPVVFCVALIAALGRRVVGTDLAARCAQACIAYVAFFWLYRFTVTSSGIETWWGYDVVAVAMAPATGVLLSVAADRRALVVAALAAALAAMLVRNLGGRAEEAYTWVSDDSARGAALLALGIVFAALLLVRRGWTPFVLPAVLALLALVLYAPSTQDARGTTGVFVKSGETEWKAYLAGKQFIELVRANESHGRRVFLWYPGNLGLVNVAWTDLPQYAQTVNELGANETLDKLTPLGVARLVQPQATSVLVFSPRAGDIGRARRTLTTAGFDGPVLRTGTLADGGLHYELMELARKP